MLGIPFLILFPFAYNHSDCFEPCPSTNRYICNVLFDWLIDWLIDWLYVSFKGSFSPPTSNFFFLVMKHVKRLKRTYKMKRPCHETSGFRVFQACGLDASHFKCWWNVETSVHARAALAHHRSWCDVWNHVFVQSWSADIRRRQDTLASWSFYKYFFCHFLASMNILYCMWLKTDGRLLFHQRIRQFGERPSLFAFRRSQERGQLSLQCNWHLLT